MNSNVLKDITPINCCLKKNKNKKKLEEEQ